MKQKDLADEYAEKEYLRVNGESAPCFIDEPCFNFDDIKAAFNAGRESVVESLPKLEWKGYSPFIHAATPIGRYNIDNFGIWLLRFNGKEIPLSTGSYLDEAKRAANEDYKKRIKQALGL
jgi:hypothetical protein|nr:MAG TPA: hypothetical protein [Caudoviricetes sp.]